MTTSTYWQLAIRDRHENVLALIDVDPNTPCAETDLHARAVARSFPDAYDYRYVICGCYALIAVPVA